MMAGPGSFWARRKAAVEAEAAAEAAQARAVLDAANAEALAAEQAGKSEAELLQELGLPNPDTMAQGDDFVAFMGRAVPEHLRRRALRKLWVSNPVLANLDGLVDHGEDYTDAATVIPGMQTAYQVGKGMMQHVAALAEQAAAEANAEANAKANPEAEAGQEAEISLTEDLSEPEAEASTTHDRLAAAAPHEAIQDETAPRPRRHMRFEFSS